MRGMVRLVNDFPRGLGIAHMEQLPFCGDGRSSACNSNVHVISMIYGKEDGEQPGDGRRRPAGRVAACAIADVEKQRQRKKVEACKRDGTVPVANLLRADGNSVVNTTSSTASRGNLASVGVVGWRGRKRFALSSAPAEILPSFSTVAQG